VKRLKVKVCGGGNVAVVIGKLPIIFAVFIIED